MQDRQESELQVAVSRGDESAFEQIYGLFANRVRLAAWRVSHRPDWLDEIVNEAWYRAFQKRTTYDPQKPFLQWIAGIVQNVYREQCRKSPMIIGEQGPDPNNVRLDEVTPEQLADEAEILSGLNDCVGQLDQVERQIVKLRFFENKTLRELSQIVGIPEATLRERRLPALMGGLRRCLEKKGLKISHIFPAQGPDETQ